MAKGKKSTQSKSKMITFKMAQTCLEFKQDGGKCLDLSFKELATVPKCIQKLWDMDEVDLSRNLIRKLPDFIEQFIYIRALDLHSNYVSMTGTVIEEGFFKRLL